MTDYHLNTQRPPYHACNGTFLLTYLQTACNNPFPNHACYRQTRGRAAQAAAGAATQGLDENDEEDWEDEDEGDEEASLNPKKPITKVNKHANLGKKGFGTNKWRAWV